jgi:hypothetical protein
MLGGNHSLSSWYTTLTEVSERSGMVNHPNPTTIIVVGHRANVTLDHK